MRNTRRYSLVVALSVFIVLAVLIAIACVFPTAGVRIHNTTLRFPSVYDYLPEGVDSLMTDTLEEILNKTNEEEEERLRLRLAEMRLEEEREYVDFFESSPSRIYLPYLTHADSLGNDTLVQPLQADYDYFNPLFAALDSAEMKHVGVVHYGDSQIEEDRISKELRLALQSRFSGGGVGLLPYKHTFYNLTVSEQLRGHYTRYSLISYDRDDIRKGNHYGPLLQASYVSSPTEMTISRRKGVDPKPANYFSRVTLLTDGDMTISVDTAVAKVAHGRFTATTFALADSSTTVRLQVSGRGDIYGVMLHNETGVNVDNIPLRGCSGTIFGSVSADQLQSYFALTNTRLIILEFGGNIMKSLTTEKAVQRYVRRLMENINYLRSLAPDACVLFIGPSDMVNISGGQAQTLKMLPYFDEYAADQMRRVGVAYWSMYNAMGGSGTMAKWVKSTPQLAAGDYVHFTRTGAQKVGTMLADALMMTYDYYKIREKYESGEGLLNLSGTPLSTEPSGEKGVNHPLPPPF